MEIIYDIKHLGDTGTTTTNSHIYHWSTAYLQPLNQHQYTIGTNNYSHCFKCFTTGGHFHALSPTIVRQVITGEGAFYALFPTIVLHVLQWRGSFTRYFQPLRVMFYSGEGLLRVISNHWDTCFTVGGALYASIPTIESNVLQWKGSYTRYFQPL